MDNKPYIPIATYPSGRWSGYRPKIGLGRLLNGWFGGEDGLIFLTDIF
jgi:hypothetical protein